MLYKAEWICCVYNEPFGIGNHPHRVKSFDIHKSIGLLTVQRGGISIISLGNFIIFCSQSDDLNYSRRLSPKTLQKIFYIPCKNCSKLKCKNFSPKLFGVGCVFLIPLLKKFNKRPIKQNTKLTIMEVHVHFGHTVQRTRFLQWMSEYWVLLDARTCRKIIIFWCCDGKIAIY